MSVWTDVGQNCRRNEAVIVFWVKECEMGLEQWGASEQYVAVIHKVLPRKSVFILKNQDYRFLFLREDIKEMEKSNIMIRLEKKEEQRKVENLVRDSFWNVYRPGCLEHYVLHQLRNDPAFVPELDFVMLLKENDEEGKLIGQNMFVRMSIKSDDGSYIPIMTMGPICIKNEYKRKGYGKILLDYSLEKATELGCGAICFEGNIDFYGKSGFRQASEYGIRYHGLPEGEDASFFLCKELVPGYLDGITGEYATPEGYLVDEQEAEGFDKQFPYKEKKKLPDQLF